ncbi:Muscle M-line assembly protein unc-89 [Frankliniella fusca]|uniref:Muscle M-line assembly protein unc-89 n=1 Tax=Frankliniella fusca TaxID=407009 RepID=A0AAE1HBB7_9NEOP|nr:Muscle M-line assembly protein unc-89 [Frankliniella fusca]
MKMVIDMKYILDAVARQFLKCIKSHGGYAGCERCTVDGDYIDNRMTFLDLDAPLRTDQSFRDKEQPQHHKGISPLEEVNTSMISQVLLDPMHMVWAGVVKRLLDFWINVIGAWKLHHEVIELISYVFEFLRPYCPTDFNRKPRSLKYFKSFKCTELRRILLYDGILVFKYLVDENVYKHFLLLHSGINILCSKSMFDVKNDDALQYLRLFVSHSARIFGSKFVVFNVHSLIHLPSECMRVDMPLYEFSAFKYENKLKSIKETLRSGLHQLQQLARREEERKTDVVKLPSRTSHVYLSLGNLHVCGKSVDEHFRKLRAGKLTLKVGKSDSCFRSRGGEIAVVQDIVKRKRKVYLICQCFHTLEDFYQYPIPSSRLGIYKVSILVGERLISRLSSVQSKCYLMTYQDTIFYLAVCGSHIFSYRKDPREYMEVSLSAWLCGDIDDEMKGQTFWPKDDRNVMKLIQMEASHDPENWNTANIQVMRFYDTFAVARAAVPKFIDDSQYETDSQIVKTRIRKRTQRFISSSEDEDIPIRKVAKTAIPPPPAVQTGDTFSAKQHRNNTRKGQGLSKDEQKRKDREELLAKLKAARLDHAAKTTLAPLKSPSRSVVSPVKSAVSPLKSAVSPLKCVVSPTKCVKSPTKCVQSLAKSAVSLTNSPKLGNSPGTPTRSPWKVVSLTDLSPKEKDVEGELSGDSTRTEILDDNNNDLECYALSLDGSPNSSSKRPASNIAPESYPFNVNTWKDLPKTSQATAKSTDKSDPSKLPFSPISTGSERLGKRFGVLEVRMNRLEVLSRESAAKLDIVLMTLGRMKRQILPGEHKISLPQSMPKLPLETREQLNKFETFLGESDLNLTAACDYFSSYVKTCVLDAEQSSAMAILPKMLYNNLAELMNLEGGNGKIGFRHLNLYKVFQGTLQTAFPKSDFTVADNALYRWLKDASKRKKVPAKESPAGPSAKSKKPAPKKGSEQ